MTKQEAKEFIVQSIKDDVDVAEIADAIMTLDQEPCEDAISRQSVIDSLHSKFADGFDSDRWWNSMSVLYAINKVPPVNPTKTGKWIPVSERLPEENETVIASTKHDVYPKARYTKEYGWECIYEPGADYWVELADVTGWMKRNELTLDDSIWSMWPPLSVRARNVLLRAGFRTIGDVLKCSRADLMRVRNMGRKSFEEVEKRFSKYGKFNGEG